MPIMNDSQIMLFEQREAIQYLIEDAQLGCIDLEVRWRGYERFYGAPGRTSGIRSTEDPSNILPHLYEALREKHLVEVEYLRERTNLNLFIKRAKVLWQQ